MWGTRSEEDPVTRGLVRYQESGSLHFVTFSCFGRRQSLRGAEARDVFERALESMRCRYRFIVAGYVVMPEHVHLLVFEPAGTSLATIVKALKLSVAVQRTERPFWQARYYDFNVLTDGKRVEKLRYLHRNPVVRGLVEKPEDWRWSSFRYYQTGVAGVVKIGWQGLE
jgi:putative transposase